MIRLLLLTIVVIAGCGKPAIGTASSGNPNIVVEHIATIDDCKVYRFVDGGYFRYVTICPRASTSTTGDFRVQSGKSSHDVPSAIEAIRR